MQYIFLRLGRIRINRCHRGEQRARDPLSRLCRKQASGAFCVGGPGPMEQAAKTSGLSLPDLADLAPDLWKAPPLGG